MVDLTTNYMGLQLAHPIVASASPLAATVQGVCQLELAGAAAVVLPSLFEEKIIQEQKALDYQLEVTANVSAEAADFFGGDDQYTQEAERYLQLIEQTVAATSIPIIASLNGVSEFGWADIAKNIEQAGAAAIELNIYALPTDFSQDAMALEDHLIHVLQSVKQQVSIPLALKISPYFSSLGNVAQRFEREGADALVMFNRFYQPDIDVEKREVVSNLTLSNENEIRLPLMWIGLLYQELDLSLAATSGVVNYREIVKFLLAGADIVMTTSALLRHGPEYLKILLSGLQDWMLRNGYASVNELRGSMSRKNIANPEVYTRAQYIKLLSEYELP